MYEQLQVCLREESRQSLESIFGRLVPRSNEVTRLGDAYVN